MSFSTVWVSENLKHFDSVNWKYYKFYINNLQISMILLTLDARTFGGKALEVHYLKF